MTARRLIVITAIAALLLPRVAESQFERTRDTMVPFEQIRAIATELSGARAFNNIVEIIGYQRDRKVDEYAGTYFEARTVERLAREYGFSDVRITRLPVEYREWDGEDAELWVTKPEPSRLIARYLDHPAVLVPGSRTADVTAPLVWVGRGMRDEDYAGRDVRGKIVLSDGSPGPVHDLAVRKHGAAGVVTFVNLYGFGVDRPDQLAQVSLPNHRNEALDDGTTFVVMLSHRQGIQMLELVNTMPEVTVRVKTKATRHYADHQVVEGWIPGDGSTDEEVDIVAHLFEFIAKQGANDDISGCGAMLEIGRTWIKLIEQGVLPRPKRAVHFKWVPEISYAPEYWKKFPDHHKKVVAMTSMDIVGSNQQVNFNQMRVLLTPYSLPGYLNELYIQFMEWMEDTQTIKFHNLTNDSTFSGRYPQFPINDPQGTQNHPFHIRIMKHAGGSDHLAYLRSNPRVPGVHYMNWHDIGYHTSEDTTKNIDPTQLKRAAMISMLVSLVMANATPEDGLHLAGLTAGHAVERIGGDLTLAVERLRAAAPDDLDAAYKEGLVLVREAYKREAAAVRSNARFVGSDAKGTASLKAIESSITAGEPQDVARLQAVYRAIATQRSRPVTLTPTLTEAEAAAARLFPRPKAGDPYVDFRSRNQPSMHPGQREFALHDEEAKNFADGSRSILDIRNAISAQLGPVDVTRVVEFFRSLEALGKWEIESRRAGTQ